jgi:RNA polymerase subunit RPABC4/transcription elongation factor Spt4
MDLWGSCSTCQRWFYMSGDGSTCPVCQSSPVAVADRDEKADASTA